MPGSPTTPSRAGARDSAPVHVAFRYSDDVGTRYYLAFAAQWLACAFPCRRFADTLAGADARLGADVDRYSFIAVDLHHLLLAGLCRRTRIQDICIARTTPQKRSFSRGSFGRTATTGGTAGTGRIAGVKGRPGRLGYARSTHSETRIHRSPADS
ncbi:MAG: hypothetical protein JOY71_04705 [Acetobacteraceae bacterium]|nr:hypothetical protein [Acetobacteraceae bacterium]